MAGRAIERTYNAPRDRVSDAHKGTVSGGVDGQVFPVGAPLTYAWSTGLGE